MKFKFDKETQEALTTATGLSYNSLTSDPVVEQSYQKTPDFFSLSSKNQRIIKPRGTIYLFSDRKMSLKSVCRKVFG